MGGVGRLMGWLVMLGSVGACASSDGVPLPSDGDVTIVAPSTVPPSITPPTTPPKISPTTLPDTTPTATTPPTTSTSAPTTTAPATIETPVRRVGFFGDSILADLSNVGGRDNRIVPLLAERLLDDPALMVVDVRNLALPGQSVLFDVGVLDPDDALLGPYVEEHLAAEPDTIDLAVVAVSTIDVNLNASSPEADRLDIDSFADTLIAQLEDVTATFRAADVDVVLVPMLGINDAMFNELRCTLEPECIPQRPDDHIQIVNARLWTSGLPMLFEDFSDFDEDGEPGTDSTWFVGVDAVRPDDGVHPNLAGQARYVKRVATSLQPVLTGS